jgi:hypothetical protein
MRKKNINGITMMKKKQRKQRKVGTLENKKMMRKLILINYWVMQLNIKLNMNKIEMIRTIWMKIMEMTQWEIALLFQKLQQN